MIARRESDAMTKWLRKSYKQFATFAQKLFQSATSDPGCAPEAIRGDAIVAQPPMLINNLWWALAAGEKMFPVSRPFRTREGKPRWCLRRKRKHGKTTCHHIIVSHGRSDISCFFNDFSDRARPWGTRWCSPNERRSIIDLLEKLLQRFNGTKPPPWSAKVLPIVLNYIATRRLIHSLVYIYKLSHPYHLANQ